MLNFALKSSPIQIKDDIPLLIPHCSRLAPSSEACYEHFELHFGFLIVHSRVEDGERRGDLLWITPLQLQRKKLEPN